MKFRAGEIAQICKGHKDGPKQKPPEFIKAGDIVEVFRVGPFKEGERSTYPNAVGADKAGCDFDYEVKHPQGCYFFLWELNLKKIEDPDQEKTNEVVSKEIA